MTEGMNQCYHQHHFRTRVPAGISLKWQKQGKMNDKATGHGRWVQSKGADSLVVKWIGIHPPVKWAWVQSLVWGDPTCCGATETRAPRLLELVCSRIHERPLLSSTCPEPVLCNRRSHCNEKSVHCYEE